MKPGNVVGSSGTNGKSQDSSEPMRKQPSGSLDIPDTGARGTATSEGWWSVYGLRHAGRGTKKLGRPPKKFKPGTTYHAKRTRALFEDRVIRDDMGPPQSYLVASPAGQLNRDGKRKQIITTLLALDPGPTTGWAFFVRGELQVCGQCPGTAVNIRNLLEQYKPQLTVYEVYRVYPWLAQSHSMSEIPTLQLIGVIKYLCEERGIQHKGQTAQQAKGFCTDDKLRIWGMFQAHGKRHANDAIRHGCHHLLFGSGEACTIEPAGPKRTAAGLGKHRGGVVRVSVRDRTTPPGVSQTDPGSRTSGVDSSSPTRC
jgi:hypothetical protein